MCVFQNPSGHKGHTRGSHGTQGNRMAHKGIAWHTRGSVLATTRLTANATSEVHVLRHDRDPSSMDRTIVRVLEQADEVRLGRLLETQERRRLKTDIRSNLLRDLTHETLEGHLTDQKVRALLVLADLAESHSAGTITTLRGKRVRGKLEMRTLARDL